MRDSKSLSLTAAGKAYLPGVQEAFKQLVFATHQLHKTLGVPSLKINLPPTFAVKWLTPRMRRFMQAHPDIDLKISTEKDMVDFTRQDFDMAVRYGRGTYPASTPSCACLWRCFLYAALRSCWTRRTR